MIGREADLAALRDEFARSADEPRAVAVGGEAGIGKTRLLAEFTREIGGDALVLVGKCVDIGTESAPYAPFTAIVRELAEEIGTDALLELAGPARAVLSVVLPELASESAVPPRTGTERLYELIAVLFENAARERRLVLVIEDIHWADRSTIELLRFLVGMLAGSGILIVVTYRSDEILRGHPLRPVLPELERSRRLTRWELNRLTRDQVAAQVAAIAAVDTGAEDDATESGRPIDDALIDDLFERSEGVPFFVEELAGAGRDGEGSTAGSMLPETLRELLLARYDRQGEGTQQLLRMLAVGGGCVRHGLFEAVYSGSADELERGVREAVDGGMLVIDDACYDFRHALVRAAVLGEVLPGERVRYHTAYADALESLASTGRPVAHEVSQHRMEAHDAVRAFPATLVAMREARASYAFARAARMGERALELWEQLPAPEQVAGMSHVALLQDTSAAWRDAGDTERALVLIDAAMAERDPADAEQHAGLLVDKARYLAALSRPGSTTLLEEALAGLAPDACSDTASAVVGDLAGRLMLEARYDEAVQTATKALELAEKAGSLSRRSIAHNIRGVSLVGLGRIDEGLAELDEAATLAATRDGAMLRYRVNSSDVMYLIGRYADAVQIGNAGVERARRLGVERTSGVMLASNTVEPLSALGRWDEAFALLEPALGLNPPPGFRVHLQRIKLWLLTWKGELQTADELWRSWAPMMRVQTEIEQQSRLGVSRVEAELALALGDVERAWRAVSVLLRDHQSMRAYDLPLLADAARTLTLLRAGAAAQRSGDAVDHIDLDSAESTLRAVLAAASDWPTEPVWGPLFEAELADEGTDAGAWQRAVAASDLATAPAHLAPYTRLRLAQALVLTGDRASAQEAAADSRRLADELGAGLIVGWLDEFERRAGIDPTSSRDRAGAHGARARATELTERERQVLELIAQGLSNKQIGERLYISTKTASVHVSAILRKLGATSRTEAVYLAGMDRASA
ncbi:ATP-binding protein [Humibacter ginsenosidimutans]|uniref:AAA family ATPase n=1 Tax=Humibacter ginsenosidimutans TaxID=2599293 RepID=A0A5B8M3K6_9MICO|nr:LuxR family transcriptional regulator [Humibacter ginsenosidimutans]QDZ14539.1 AAA family ATPase [Humibacter ginsenosidimutans]